MLERKNHLRRLDDVWITSPIYFITTSTVGRANRLANENFHAIAVEVWKNCERLYGWVFGRYVIMPDHVHFFTSDARGAHSLSVAVGKWKEWTAKYAARRLNYSMPLWQPEFFDHLMRNSESYEEKWHYVQDNPERARLVTSSKDWKYQGTITELWSEPM